MTWRTILRWWWLDLVSYYRVWRPRPLGAAPMRREGRMCQFLYAGTSMSRPVYTVRARRGEFRIGTLEWRNQWGYYSIKMDPEVPLNMEIIAEIYAMMRELGGDRVQPQ